MRVRKALILAAGEGTRLRPLTLERPKPMVSVAGVPILEHLVALTRFHGVQQVIVNLHYKPEAIVSHFGDGGRFGVEMTYSDESPALLGSAGAVAHIGRSFFDEPFFVLYGDVLTDLNLTALADVHAERGALATLALYEVEDPGRCGIVDVASDGRVRRFVEKPAPGTAPGNLANAGIYVLEPEILNHLQPGVAPLDFGHDVFPLLLQRDLPLYAHRTDGYVLDIGSPERYAQAEADFWAGHFRSYAQARELEAAGAC